MKKKANHNSFIKKPTYVGGLKAMRQFISNEIKYPQSALKNKIEGSVYIKYVVNYKGVVISSKVINHLGHGCDEEAKRIVSKLKFYVGKNPRKLKIKFNKSIKINFKLPKKKAITVKKPKKQETQELIYTITNTPKNKADHPNNQGYSYTIRY